MYEHLRCLRALLGISSRHSNPKVLLVHAGFIPGLPPEEHSYRDLTTMRNVEEVSVEDQETDRKGESNTADALQGSNSSTSTSSTSSSDQQQPHTTSCRLRATENRAGTGWATLWRGPEVVYFGHDAKRRLQVPGVVCFYIRVEVLGSFFCCCCSANSF